MSEILADIESGRAGKVVHVEAFIACAQEVVALVDDVADRALDLVRGRPRLDRVLISA